MPLDGETTISEFIGNEKNEQKTIKIEITSAVFIHRQWTNEMSYVTVDVIPFHQIESCNAVLKESNDSADPGISETRYLGD